jgi:phage gpG-like protein
MDVQVKVIATDLERALKIARRGNLQTPIKNARDYQLSATLDRLEREVSPSGVPWVDLKPATWAKKTNPKKLQESKDMMNKIRVRIVGNELEIVSDDEKSSFHQFGTKFIPQRKFLGFSKKDLREIVKIFERYAQFILTKKR